MLTNSCKRLPKLNSCCQMLADLPGNVGRFAHILGKIKWYEAITLGVVEGSGSSEKYHGLSNWSNTG